MITRSRLGGFYPFLSVFSPFFSPTSTKLPHEFDSYRSLYRWQPERRKLLRIFFRCIFVPTHHWHLNGDIKSSGPHSPEIISPSPPPFHRIQDKWTHTMRNKYHPMPTTVPPSIYRYDSEHPDRPPILKPSLSGGHFQCLKGTTKLVVVTCPLQIGPGCVNAF
jgi:hypothetical protein